MKRHLTCEHNLHNKHRCRKSATVAIIHKYVFATRVTGQGNR